MKIFIPETEENSSVFISGDDARHIFAHRPQPGDKVFCGDGKRFNYDCEIEKITKDGLYITAKTKSSIPSPAHETVLYNALLKGDKNEFVIQKATELGVSKIVFFESKNCVAKLDAKKRVAKKERFEKISRQAAMQCGRDILPEIGDFTTFDKIFEEEKDPIFFYEKADACLFSEYLKNHVDEKRFAFIVGPEGGFSEKEAQKATNALSLGKLILRAETVPIAVLAIIAATLGEM